MLRHGHRDPVTSLARFESILQRKAGLLYGELVGELRLHLRRVGLAQQILAAHVNAGRLGGRFTQPLRQRCQVGNRRRQVPVIEFVQRLLRDNPIGATLPRGELFNVMHKLLVLLQELGLLRQVPFDQSVLDQKLPRGVGIDGAECSAATRYDGQSEQRDPFEHHGRARSAIPVRFVVGAIHQVSGQRLDPVGIDPCDDAPETTACFDELGCHRPFGSLCEQRRPGPEVQLHVARSRVLVGVAAIGHTGEEAAEQSLMHGVVVVLARMQFAAAFFGQHPELPIDVGPFTHPVGGEKILPAGFLELVAREGLFQVMIEVPEFEDAEEVRTFVDELLMSLIRGFRLVGRSLAGVLDFQPGGDDQDFFQTIAFVGGEDHATDTRIDRQSGQFASHVRESAIPINGSQFEQRLVAVTNGIGARRIEKRKVFDGAQFQHERLQNHAGQIRAANFGSRVRVARQVVFFTVQTNADAGTQAATPSFALIGRGP